MPRAVADVRHAWRKLMRAPTFTAISIATLALGIGATTAIFTVVDGVLLKPLPYPESGRLVALYHTAPVLSLPRIDQSDGTYLVYAEQSRLLEHMGAYDETAVSLTGDAEPERATAARITASILPTLRVVPLRGRAISVDDDKPGAPPVVMLGERLWARRFGRDPGVVGRMVQIDGVSREVIGILPARFTFPSTQTELWLPLALDRAKVQVGNFNFHAIGRLKPGVDIAAVQSELQRILPRAPEEFPGLVSKEWFDNVKMRVIVAPLRDDVVGDIARVLWIVLATVGFVLLIACANVANLFLVRAESRQKELAVRAALGASRGEVLRQFLIEGLVLAGIGGAAGVGLAEIAVRLLRSLAPTSMPRLDEVGVDPTVVLFAVGVSAISALLFSALPALRYGSPNLNSVLKEGGRGSSVGRERRRARSVLVVAQVALALVLLAGSGLMLRSFVALRTVKPGFDAAHTLTLRLALPNATYPRGAQRARFFAQLSDRVAQLRGVRAVGLISQLPLQRDGESVSGEWIEDFPIAAGGVPPIHHVVSTTAGYFTAMGIPIIAGRDFDRADRERASSGIIVSRAFAEKYWKSPSAALGKRVRPLPDAAYSSIVGVAGDVHDVALERPVETMVYYPLVGVADSNEVESSLSLIVRTSADPRSLADAIRGEIHALDAGLPIFNVQPMEAVVTASMARTTFTMMLLGAASIIALVLGAVGIYGVMSYMVSLRTREIGVRMALGARSADVSRMVSREGLTLAAIGIAVGVSVALVLTRFLAVLLYDVSPTDPVTLGGVSALLIVVALVASWLPARRAARVDPIVALRAE